MENELFESIDGSFVYTIYKSDTYMVCKFETNEGTITTTGPSFDYLKGEKYTLTGNYVDHPKYGFQFNIITINKFIPNKQEDIIKFLSSANFKGVGKKAATKIYNAFGDEVLSIIKNDPSVLDNIGLSNKQLLGIRNGLENLVNEDNETILLLISVGFSNGEAQRIYYHYRENTPFILKDNPFRFYLDIPNMPFNKVLHCAKGLDFENKEYKFKEAYLIYIFKEISFGSGNTYLSLDDFKDIYLKDYSDFDDVLDICIKDKEIIKEEERYYYKQEYEDEIFISKYLKDIKNNDNYDETKVEYALKDIENNLGIKYDDDQIVAIRTFFKESFSLIIGGPGSGKTTIIKTLVSIFKELYPFQNIIVVAPTGRAAKRINEICEVESKTIHSLLKWNKDTNTFVHKKDNPILYDCLIIDEFSMVDNNLFSCLLKASQYVKKICVIGDINQLPSIRQGELLKDIVSSKLFNTTYLRYNHRQKDGSDIIDLANDIIEDNVDFRNYKKDVEFIDINHFSLNELILRIKNDINLGNNLDDIQVLSPMYRGIYGIDNLNLSLQEAINPPSKYKKEKKIGKVIYRENDKILQLKNRPTDDVYNGDIGILEEIDEDDKYLLVNFDTVNVFYEFSELSDISHAYSLSVHKSQGSEYNVVYFICCRPHINMLYKKLIYTAISRAKNKLIIIGDINTFNNGIKKELEARKTYLLNRLID